MANEDPAGIPEQIRQNRPFFFVLAAAVLIAIGTFLYVLSRDTESSDIERNLPPADLNEAPASAPATAPDAAAPAAPVTATDAPAGGAAPAAQN